MVDLNDLISKVKFHWKKNLKSKGVKEPSGSKLVELACLFSYMPNPISQDEIEKWHIKNGKEYKRQARHLADSGWYIKSGNSRFTRGVYEKKFKSNQMSLHSVKKTNPIWSKNNEKRINNLSSYDWENILKKFNQRGCAVCGRRMRHYDKGHILKSKSYNKSNIVPMCVDCNNWGQEFEFKEYRGLVFRPIITKVRKK